MRYSLIVFLISFIFAQAFPEAIAQPLIAPAPQAQTMGVIDGIELGEVYSITQSRNGLIWFGTLNGLVRFDGYNATRFVHNSNDNSSLSNDTVMDIVDDGKGNLWLSTVGGGLNKMDVLNESFSQVHLPGNNGDQLYQLSLGAQQTLWIGSEHGPLRLNLEDDTPMPLPPALNALSNTTVSRIFVDSHKHLWLTTPEQGLYHFDGTRLTHYAADDKPGALLSNAVLSITEDGKGQIWVGTGRGLQRYDDKKHGFAATSTQNTGDTSERAIRSLSADHLGRLWLGTQNSGTWLYTPKTDQLVALDELHDLQQNFKARRVNDLFTDREGSLWLATDNGVILTTKAALDIQYLTNEDATLAITDIEPLNSGKVAFAGNYQYYEYDALDNTAEGQFADENRLYRITQTDEGDLLFATLGQGLQRYSPATDKLTQLPFPMPLHGSTPVTGLFDSFIDKQKQIWLLPFPDLPHLAGGIIHMDRNNNQYITYLSSPFISDILQLSDQQLLLSSDAVGLITLNMTTKEAERWQQDIASTPRRVFTLFKDSEGVLWLGTRDQGLAKFDEKQRKFVFYTVKDGLLSNNVYSIVEDRHHHLWLGCDTGLTRFTPKNGQTVNLEEQDGLLFSAFYKRSAAITKDGQLLLGTHNGLVSLNPDDFSSDIPEPQVFISDFKLFNRSVDWHDEANQALLTKPVSNSDEIVLDHAHSMFSFEFAATEYIRPDKIRYAYMMEGLNDQWVYAAPDQHSANYTTLPHGEYTFRVKATDRNGRWGEQEASIKVTMLPPWWLSWPAYLLYIVVISLTVVLFINIRTKKLVQRAQQLEQRVAARTRELKDSRDQVSELLAQKQQLFASVSHEFRTPLTLILSPVEQLMKDPKGQPVVKELGLIKRNGRRLLRMVDQLLEFAKLELKDDSQMEPVSLKQTLDIIVSSFEPLVQSKQIALHVSPYEDAILTMLPDSLNKILINILSNAYKYSPPGADIFVTVERLGPSVAIAIRDTGIGISESDIDAVFQRFNRATQSHGEAIPGAGIGLALVKELVEANGGRIVLESKLNEGSTFTVTLPVSDVDLLYQGKAEGNLHDVIHEHLDLEIDSVNSAQTASGGERDIELDEQRKSILIVDDNPDLRDLLYQQLSSSYQCLMAENGRVGLDIARELLPDLVISDVMMPLMDGYQLTEALKGDELTSHIPVILLTAKGSMESRLKGLQLLVDDYLAKPFNMEELSLRIHNILTIRDIIKQKFRRAMDQADPSEELIKLSVSDPEQAFVNRVNDQLSRFYCEPEFTAKVLSRELGVSERQLQRKLKSQFDLSFPELVRNFRLNKAVEMLSSGQRASQIYHLVGFSSHSYFSSCFKAKFGRTPREYQQELH